MANIEPGPNEDLIRYHLKMKKLQRELTDLMIDNMMKRNMTKKQAMNYIKRIQRGESASYLLELNHRTNTKTNEIFDFLKNNEELSRRNRRERPKPIYPRNRGFISNRNVERVENYFKWRGPTEANKTRKRNLMNELKSIPTLGIFPGGTNFLRLKENHENNFGKTRKRNTQKRER